MIGNVLRLYQVALSRRPYLTQSIQSATFMGAGDLVSQVFIEKKTLRNVDFKRTLHFSTIGFCVVGPAVRTWFVFLNNRIGSTGPAVAIKKVVLDQLFYAPTILLFLLSSVSALKGNSFEKIKMDVRSNYFDIIKTNYCVWPWVGLVNFCYVPLHYQVLVVQTVALFWNAYLSWKANNTRQIERKLKE